MRALCGAIITAGPSSAWGLTALGIGTRYAKEYAFTDGEKKQPIIAHLSQMDTPLIFILVLLTIVTLVGLGIAFVGLAYHHARREREHILEKDRIAAHHRTAV